MTTMQKILDRAEEKAVETSFKLSETLEYYQNRLDESLLHAKNKMTENMEIAFNKADEDNTRMKLGMKQVPATFVNIFLENEKRILHRDEEQALHERHEKNQQQLKAKHAAELARIRLDHLGNDNNENLSSLTATVVEAVPTSSNTYISPLITLDTKKSDDIIDTEVNNDKLSSSSSSSSSSTITTITETNNYTHSLPPLNSVASA